MFPFFSSFIWQIFSLLSLPNVYIENYLLSVFPNAYFEEYLLSILPNAYSEE
jgi:hypothetical protein